LHNLPGGPPNESSPAALTLFATPLFAVSVTPQVTTLGYGVAVGFGVTCRIQALPSEASQGERAKTESDIKNYKYYPVVGIGFSFGF
jgi:hypothetical protein